MARKPSYEALQQRVKELEKEAGERLRMERELLKLSHAVNHSPSAIMITDAHGIIEYVNPKFVDMTGFTAQEVLGKNAGDLGEQSAEEEEKMWQVLKSGGEWRGEFLNKKKDGKRYWERASISSMKDPDGGITHYVKVAEDITDLKRAQQELRESQEALYEHQKRLGILKFANDMALRLMHELRNPLVSIGGFSKRIADGHYGEDNLTKYTKIIFEEAKKLDQAVSELLVQLETTAHKA
ncbi:MAG: PAS domain S-box protein [Thermodesulfobacteriota bacterium]|nr:PAS domain S-box protein [Thermodesulfobacteriota bacterium]